LITYKQAGVDVSANTRWVSAIERAMHATYGPRVPKSRHGLFAGLFRLDYDEQLFRRNYKKPMLIGCTDGVGTKVLLAIAMKRLDTIGIDLVAMNVNDLICCGGEPLFFLDYLAVSKLDPAHLLAVVEGIAEGCKQAGCALLGGETAEMPDLYHPGHLDLAGFAVGVVELDKVIDGSRIDRGDVLIGLPSSGVHSNGYTLVRKLIEKSKHGLDDHVDELGETLGDALLRPTRIYVRSVLSVLRAYKVKRIVTGLAHITGGGLKENIARILPPNRDALIEKRTLPQPPIFPYLQRLGVSHAEMYKVFNMGIGFVLIVKPTYVTRISNILRKSGETPFIIGKIQRGGGRVVLR
jgi:phosphoribosylformylglycinamidine cyclo-ligase